VKGRTLILEFHAWTRPHRRRTTDSRRFVLGFVSIEWCRGTWGERVRHLTDELTRLRAIIAGRIGPRA
jgi:hypothetical protein